MQLIIGIDIGTTNCKAVIIDTAGKVLQEEKIAYADKVEGCANTEQNADDVFKAVLLVAERATDFTKNMGIIGAVCFSAAMHSILIIDEEGNALNNAITWADSRSSEQAKHLLANPLSHFIYEQTGTPIHPMSPLCKIIWWKEMQPGLFKKAHKFISLKEYVWFKLFGEYVIDHSIASATGLFDIYDLQWCTGALQLAGIAPQQLSTPVTTLHRKYLLNEAYCAQLNITSSTPFFIGGSDGCMANLGTGVLDTGKAALTIGTSGAVRTTVSKPRSDKQQRLFNYIITGDLFITGGPINNGGMVLQWFAKNFLDKSFETETDLDWLAPMAGAIPAGAEKLIFLPYLLGERAPIWNADAKGVFFGLTAAHTKEHLLRALLEGISYALHDVLVSIESIYGTIEEVYASGGFIHSKFWLQLLSDILGKKIIVVNIADASATGAAFLGMYGAGFIADLSEIKNFITQEEIFHPNADNHAVYRQYFKVYQSLYFTVKDMYQQLNKLP